VGAATVLRAATVAEIEANLAERQEFEARSKFNAKFVNTLLRWANGLAVN
jgi:folate-dependent phosphoribosylglycinamide formyltransferase PurN